MRRDLYPFRIRDPRLLRAALACFALSLLPLAALFWLNGCASARPQIDPDTAFVTFINGVEGTSMAPLRFPKPLVAVRAPWPPAIGSYAVRLDQIGLGWRFTLHEVVAGPLPDGSYVMQGRNRATNPRPDADHLTPANYIGIAFPISRGE